MPEEVTHDEQAGLIRVRAWGDDSIQDWMDSREKVLALYREHGLDRLLVDVREQQTTPSTTEIFQFGKDWPATIRCALLVGNKTQNDHKFLETVALNRGKPMRVFVTEQQALAWLRE